MQARSNDEQQIMYMHILKLKTTLLYYIKFEMYEITMSKDLSRIYQ